MKSIAVEAGTFEILRGEMLRSARTRYQHRLHAVLLVAGGLSCRRAAGLLGDSARSVENWVNRYNSYKLKGLKDNKMKGRPPRLSAAQAAEVRAALSAPAGAGARRWSGARLAAFLAQRCGVKLGVRQAQRLLARLERGRVANDANSISRIKSRK